MTPEGRVKAQVKRLLNSYFGVYYEMLVPTGYGKSGLDFSCCVEGRALYIETKAPGEELTPRQRETALKQHYARATVLIISNADGLRVLKNYLDTHAQLKDA
jgi:hypothetical protein